MKRSRSSGVFTLHAPNDIVTYLPDRNYAYSAAVSPTVFNYNLSDFFEFIAASCGAAIFITVIIVTTGYFIKSCF